MDDGSRGSNAPTPHASEEFALRQSQEILRRSVESIEEEITAEDLNEEDGDVPKTNALALSSSLTPSSFGIVPTPIMGKELLLVAAPSAAAAPPSKEELREVVQLKCAPNWSCLREDTSVARRKSPPHSPRYDKAKMEADSRGEIEEGRKPSAVEEDNNSMGEASADPAGQPIA